MQNEPGPEAIVRATNILQRKLSSGEYLGGQWLEGSPTNEESMYWFNLLLDVTVPLVGHSAQRPHGTVSADGDRNIVDGVGYITSRVWEDGEGRDRVGTVMIVDEVIYASREVAKTDARPGNYVATGGHGGIVGSATGNLGTPFLTYVPVRKHTHRSALRVTQLPVSVVGVEIDADGSVREADVRIKNGAGELAPDQMPVIRMMKFGRYAQQCCAIDEVRSWFAHASHRHPLVGIVAEGKSPYGKMDPPAEAVLRVAAFSGMPVVKVGRGNTAGFSSAREPWAIRGNNLTATKARLLAMACLLKFGALPPAADPEHPTEEERGSTFAAVKRLQEIFDTH
jgi:L-asparaginase/Glu-tRNA(Gln) amidotransferase subunit D